MDRFWLPQYPPAVPADIDPFEIDGVDYEADVNLKVDIRGIVQD